METQFPAGSRRKPHRRSPAGGGRRGCMPHNAVNPKRRREGKPLSAANLKPRRRAGIPVDLTREILLRLPVRSLLRFRLVSKLWLSVTRDHQFIQSHLDLSRNTRLPSIVFLPVYKRRLARIARLDPEKPLSTLVVGPYLTRLQQHTIRANRSCNGLIAITDEDARIQVVNPSTGQSITPPRQTVGSSCVSARVSLGYHPVTKVYKLVNFFHSRDHTWIGCEVYSLGTSSWREVARFDSFPSIDRVAVSAKGFMYWRVRLKGFYFGGGFSLLRFDLRDEVFIQTPIFELKQFYNRWKHYQVSSDLVNLQDNICLPVFSRSEVFEIRQMDLWMLNEDDHSWTRKYSLDFALGEHYLTERVTPLLIHMDKVLLHVKTVTAPRNQRAKCHLQYHDLRRCDEEQTKDSTKSHEEVKVFNNNFFPIVHVESLILLPEVEDTDLELRRHRG